jgi:hypothetical protein
LGAAMSDGHPVGRGVCEGYGGLVGPRLYILAFGLAHG